MDYDAKPMEFFAQRLWGELQQKMSSTSLIGHMTDSLDTGQTEDVAFNSTTMAKDSGETCHPWTTHYIAHVQINSKETTSDLWLCQKDH